MTATNFPSSNAFIHSEAVIGKNVTISPFCYIDKDVIIGDNTWIGPNVTIFEGTRIGHDCKLFPGAVIGGIPQDLKFKGEKTTVEIGNHTTIREYVTINRGTQYSWKTTIGDHCLLMAYVHVAHDCILGNRVILANAVNLAGHVVLEDHVILEGLVAVQQFMRIGAHSFIAGGSLVRKNVPPYVKAGREPLAYIGVNAVGLSRRGFDKETIHHIQKIYRHIFVSGSSLRKAVEIVKQTIAPSQERNYIVQFIQNSPKGIMKGFNSLVTNPNGQMATNGHHNIHTNGQNGQSNAADLDFNLYSPTDH